VSAVLPAPAAPLARFVIADVLVKLLLILAGVGLALFLLAPMLTIFMRAVQDNNGNYVGLVHFASYFSTPALARSVWNSVWVSVAVAAITVPAAFLFAYGLTRSCMPVKGTLRLVALIPLLAPSLLPAIAFIQWFGNQGVLKGPMQALGIDSIYGAPGIILSEVFNCFPHALMILIAALALADGRLYEAADALGTRRLRRFFTITLPGCKYGLLSAFTVVFTYAISDFGAPKVIGGNFNVLAVDVFKQVIGQFNFSIGAVVGLLLLVPSVVAFAVDWVVRRRLTANLTARSVPYAPKPRAVFDKLMLAYCALVCLLLLAVLGMAVYTSLIHLWPYNLSFTLKHYHYALVGGDYAPAFWNSLKMGAWTAVIGTVFVFCTAYLLEKTRGLGPLRPALRLLALLSMAVPGLVLGLGYIMFFNHPANPLNFLYQTMAILAISTVVHYYTSGHLTAVTALKALDDEYEAVSASLKVPFYKTFWRVTVPVCLPAILEIARYYFVVSISTLSCVVFLYAPHTILAAVAIMNMDEAGDIGPAAALGTLTVLASVVVCLVYALVSGLLMSRSQAWRFNVEKS
jgi:iron(III) transport system permease protein